MVHTQPRMWPLFRWHPSTMNELKSQTQWTAVETEETQVLNLCNGMKVACTGQTVLRLKTSVDIEGLGSFKRQSERLLIGQMLVGGSSVEHHYVTRCLLCKPVCHPQVQERMMSYCHVSKHSSAASCAHKVRTSGRKMTWASIGNWRKA